MRAGARVFEKLIRQRNQQISYATSILSRDHAFQEAFAGASEDRETTLSALTSLQGRVKADLIFIVSLEKELLFDTQRPEQHGFAFPFPGLIDRAEATEFPYAFVIFDNQLYAIAVTPLLAPDPIAWLCTGFRITDGVAREIKTYADSEITFLGAKNFFATTLNDEQRANLLSSLNSRALLPSKTFDVRLHGEVFLSCALTLPTENGNTTALLQRSLDKELAPYVKLERTYLALALLGLALSAALGIWIARGVSRPVLQLAEGARKIAAGNYQHRVDIKQEDELGLLGRSFNRMTEGLVERDHVRDLLGKVVSPEVAAELLRKDVVLGGEEREVTVLFSDLRNFTAMSEKASPKEMLGILNHYFTRMSAIVEKHGGIVDKYVGDALMALFGAPLRNPDDPDRAMKAALEMIEALDEINEEWETLGLPTIGVGIGINTDVVVAGNMGSETRLNYTVIGDGVNLASRLEALTKNPDYDARIIVSGSTLTRATGRYSIRDLGAVAVKGKQKPTEIFALLGRQ